MKTVISILLSVLFIPAISAQVSDEAQVRSTIESFFEGFHKQDSVLMKQHVGENPRLQTIGKTKQGEAAMRTGDFSKFLSSIVSIPDSVKFQEKLKSFSIQVDGDMANAWTPYEFWLNDTFSHCGVNSFQLFREQGKWKIIYLIDTRRREDCPE